MERTRRELSLVVDKGAGPLLTRDNAGRTTLAEIDELYQLPLAEFTAARNALAKRLGKANAAITELPKPSVPAWAVNQLYWRHRDAYDELIEASERLRQEHHTLLAGRPSNVRTAEQAHRDAIRRALAHIRGVLDEAGEAASPATLAAVAETLEALPSPEPPGRLARPLKRLGFEALTGVTPRPPSAPRPARKAAAAREVARRKERLLADARRAEAALEKARAQLARAEADVERHEEALAEARQARDRLQTALSLALSEYQRTSRLARE